MFWSVVADASERDPADDFWYGPVGQATSSGVHVTAERALALPAVYSAVRVITDAMAQIPLILYRRTDDGGKERANVHPLYRLLHRKPNEQQTSSEWREVMQNHVLMRGNAYSRILDMNGNRITKLDVPFHPDTVRSVRMRRADGGVRYDFKVRQDDGEITLQQDQVLHIRGLGIASDGLTGLSPIDVEREAIGAGLAAQDFTGRFFSNDAQPGTGWVEHPAHFASEEKKQNWVKAWRAAQAGASKFRTPVLEYGMKYHPLEIKLVDAQFLETRKYTNMDIARIFRVPPHLIMELDRATFSNITQQDIEFVKFTMLPWLTRWEQRLSASLLNDDEQEEYFFEFLVDGLERGDGEARARYYKAGIVDGWLTRNEVRRRENLNPLDGLDEPLEPMNMRNPGGDNDERLNALKESAATAMARKQRHQAQSSDNPAMFMRNDWATVREFMRCPTSDAQRYSDFSAALLQNRPNGIDWASWEASQVQLAMEMT
jgi:HK97 family phage portal protein